MTKFTFPIFLIGLFFTTIQTSYAQWDLGAKWIQSSQPGLQIEFRKHFDNNLSVTANAFGSKQSSFGQNFYQYEDTNATTSTFYFQQSSSQRSALGVGAGIQYTLPYWNELLYFGFTTNVGVTNTYIRSRFYEINGTINPQIDFNHGLLLGGSTPENYSINSSRIYTESVLNIGVDLPLYERFLITGGIQAGVKYTTSFLSIEAGFNAGIRYKFGVNKS